MWKKQITNLVLGFALLTGCASQTSTIRTHLLQTEISTPGLTSTGESTSLAVTLGGLGYEQAASLTILPGGSFLLGGSTIKSVGETTDFFLSKMDSLGTVEWFRTYGGPHRDDLVSITRSKEGGFLLWGETRSLFFTPLSRFDTDLKSLLVKVDKAGVGEWSLEIRAVPTDLVQTQEGTYLLAGAAYIRGNADLSLVKFDQAGNHIWQWTYRSPELNSYEGLISVTELPSGEFLLLGSSSGSSTRWIIGSPLLIRVGANGELQWSRRLDGSTGRVSQMIRFQDGFTILGHVGEEDEILLTRTDAEGNILWTNSYGGRYDDRAFSIIEDSKGLLVIGGATKSAGKGDWDGMLMGVRKNGEIAYCLTIGSADTDWIRSVQEAENDQLFVLGETAGMGPGLRDIFFTTGQSKEGGLWQSCEDEIKVQPIHLQSREIQLIGDRGGIKVRRIPTELQRRPSWIGLRESGFPVLPEGP
jgi:hypothetical protein